MKRDIERNFGRRTFLKSAGAIAGCAALGQATHVFAATKDSRGIPFFSYLEIGGEFHSGIWIDGGGPQAPVMAGAFGPDGAGPKTNGPTRFDDIQFLLPLARSKTLWPWIQESLSGSAKIARREANLFWLDPSQAPPSRSARLSAQAGRRGSHRDSFPGRRCRRQGNRPDRAQDCRGSVSVSTASTVVPSAANAPRIRDG